MYLQVCLLINKFGIHIRNIRDIFLRMSHVPQLKDKITNPINISHLNLLASCEFRPNITKNILYHLVGLSITLFLIYNQYIDLSLYIYILQITIIQH